MQVGRRTRSAGRRAGLARRDAGAAPGSTCSWRSPTTSRRSRSRGARRPSSSSRSPIARACAGSSGGCGCAPTTPSSATRSSCASTSPSGSGSRRGRRPPARRHRGAAPGREGPQHHRRRPLLPGRGREQQEARRAHRGVRAAARRGAPGWRLQLVGGCHDDAGSQALPGRAARAGRRPAGRRSTRTPTPDDARGALRGRRAVLARDGSRRDAARAARALRHHDRRGDGARLRAGRPRARRSARDRRRRPQRAAVADVDELVAASLELIRDPETAARAARRRRSPTRSVSRRRASAPRSGGRCLRRPAPVAPARTPG